MKVWALAIALFILAACIHAAKGEFSEAVGEFDWPYKTKNLLRYDPPRDHLRLWFRVHECAVLLGAPDVRSRDYFSYRWYRADEIRHIVTGKEFRGYHSNVNHRIIWTREASRETLAHEIAHAALQSRLHLAPVFDEDRQTTKEFRECVGDA